MFVLDAALYFILTHWAGQPATTSSAHSALSTSNSSRSSEFSFEFFRWLLLSFNSKSLEHRASQAPHPMHFDFSKIIFIFVFTLSCEMGLQRSHFKIQSIYISAQQRQTLPPALISSTRQKAETFCFTFRSKYYNYFTLFEAITHQQSHSNKK